MRRYRKWITHIKLRYVQPKYGFTLIETLVAITIVSLAISGPLYSANRTIISAQISSDQLTASYLAQEGLEYVHAIRDNNYLSFYQAGGSNVSTNAWTNFLSITAICKTAVCTLDPWKGNAVSVAALAVCPSGVCNPLYLSPPQRYTQQNIGSKTKFTREISITPVTLGSGKNEVKVVSEVKWKFHNIPYSVKATDHLTAWQ